VFPDHDLLKGAGISAIRPQIRPKCIFITVHARNGHIFASGQKSDVTIVLGQNGQEGRIASACQILSKSVKPQPRYGDFSIFQDGGGRHLEFLEISKF